MDLGVLEETIRLSTTAQDAVLYLCNSLSFANLVIQVLFPELPEDATSFDLTVLTEGLLMENDIHGSDSPRQPAGTDEVGLVVLDNGPESLSSNRISSSNSTILFDNSGQPHAGVDDAETRRALFLAAGCGFWEEPAQQHLPRRPDSKSILTVLDLLLRVTSAVELCVRKCKNEHNAKSSALLMEWVVRTGVWKYTPEGSKLSSICNGRRETQLQIAQIVASHARRSGSTELARAISDWLSSNLSSANKAQQDSAADHEDIFVVDPRRMTMLALAQLLTQLDWQPQMAKAFQLTDRHLVRPLLAICVSNSVVAARLFASFEQLPRICAKLHQEANARGLEECFKLLYPKDEQWSLENLPTSILSAATTPASQWWESTDTITTLAHVVRGTSIPFSSLLCALVIDDDTELSVAIEQAYALYVLVELSGATIVLDPKRRALLSMDCGECSTSKAWCLRVFNVLCRRRLQQQNVSLGTEAEDLVLRTAAAMEELRLLRRVLTSACGEASAQEFLTPRVIWRTLSQAARNENDVAPPSLTRYVSPELLAECPTVVAPLVTAFNLWWSEKSSAVMSSSLLKGSRAMISEHACKVCAGARVQAIEMLAENESPFEVATMRILDAALLEPHFFHNDHIGCDAFTIATLYFLVCGENRYAFVDQLIASSNCLRPNLLRCLWTGDDWGSLLKQMLCFHSTNSEESVHMMSVCTLLASFPSYAALELMKKSSGALEEPELDKSGSPGPSKTLECRSLRGAQFLQHSIGGLLNDHIDPEKLLSIHAARELLKTISGLPEMGPCALKFDAAIGAVYESGKKHLNVLGLALSESVRLLLSDQMTMVKELESKCRKSLLRCVELADQTRHQVHDVCLSSTICDICGLLLTQHSTAPNIHSLEQEAFVGKVCAMNRCDHRYHALCLRSFAIALDSENSELFASYVDLLNLFDSFSDIETEASIKAELVKNLQNLIGQNCPLCSNDLTIAI